MNLARQLEILKRLFKPAVKFCVRQSISVSTVVECIKGLFVECTIEELGKNEEDIAVSRISLISGLTRREVNRLLLNITNEDRTPSILTRVLSTWEQNPRFCKDRKPRVLAYEGEESDFRLLVASISKDIGAGTVLSELVRIRAVEVTDRGVKLVNPYHDHTYAEDRVIALLIKNLDTLSVAAEENIYQKPIIKNLHARTEYDNVSPHAVPIIRQWLLEKGLEFHKMARDFMSQFDQDMNPVPGDPGGGRVCLGSFSLSTLPETQLQAEPQEQVA